MNHKSKIIIIILFLCTSGISYASPTEKERGEQDTIIAFDDTRKVSWAKEFRYVEIESSIDKKKQEAYFYKTTSVKPQPLVVSLHTWSGTYAQIDSLSTFSKNHNYNYIHPDFRG